ncbi:MAG: hypothetical protein ABIZ49_05840 [Opitutaceae bacterium]
MITLVAVNIALVPGKYPFAAFGAWVAMIALLRLLLTGAHRRGISLVKRGQFAEAIPCFKASYAAMKHRPWVDRFRWPLLGSASRWTYREMALANVAFCYGQIGDGAEMRAHYEKTLVEFPDSVLAATALRMMRATQGDPALSTKP